MRRSACVRLRWGEAVERSRGCSAVLLDPFGLPRRAYTRNASRTRATASGNRDMTSAASSRSTRYPSRPSARSRRASAARRRAWYRPSTSTISRARGARKSAM